MAALKFVLSLLGLCAMAGFVTCQKCHKDWYSFNGSCYGFGTNLVTWAEAQAICKAANGTLAEIDSAEENALLRNIARNNQASCTWLGGTDMFQESSWVWISTNQQIDQFVDWAAGEPNDSRNEDCLVFHKPNNYQWADYACYRPSNFLCEYRPE